MFTSDELALIERAANAPTRVIGRYRTFSISSEGGVIVPADFTYSGLDVNGNGVEDCLDSYLGFNSLLEGSAFGLTGGCWNIDQGGVVRIYEDGLVAGPFNQFGGDGIHAIGFDPDYLSLDDEKISINLSGKYDLAENLTAFAEFKYVTQETFGYFVNTGSYDLLTVAPDNPFIPSPLDTIAAAAGGFYITRDPIDLGASNDRNDHHKPIQNYVEQVRPKTRPKPGTTSRVIHPRLLTSVVRSCRSARGWRGRRRWW